MANVPTDESSRMAMLQSRMGSRLSLDNPKIHSCYWKSTSESILTTRYGTRRSRNGLVVGGATTYKRGMTVPESKPTLLQAITVPGLLRGRTKAHLPAENRSWWLVDECALEEITSRVNKHMEKSQPDEMTSEFRKRRCGYPDKWQREQLEKKRKAYPEESRRAQRAIGDDKCTEHRADVKCTYKCTDLEDDQCDCNSTGEMMRWSSEFDLCRTSAIMSTEAGPNETENDLRTYRIVYQTASQATVTKRHRKRQSQNGIMRDSWDNYGEMMTEHSDQDHGQITPSWDWIRGLSGALHRRHRLGCLPTGLPNRMLNDHTGGL